MASNSSTTYASKYGSITLLNRINYATWKPDIQAILLAANAFDIVTGESAQPAGGDRRLDWVKRRGIALNLLYMSTTPEIRNTLTTYLNDLDITGMWEHLKSLDLSQDAVYCLDQVRAFNLEVFSTTDTVESFAQRLISYQLKLQDTDYRLTDTLMVMKLCMGMPSDSDWAVTRLTVLRDNITFSQAVAQYQITERLRPATLNSRPATTESATLASNIPGGRGNKRGRGRGGSFRGSNRRGRGGRNVSTSESITTEHDDRCYWCLKKGHMRKNCRDYKRAVEKARQGRTLNERDQETANVAISPNSRVEEIEEVSAYITSADQSDTTKWILDSGASKHMCGDRTLLSNLKRFESPQQVKLADNTSIRAYGKGMTRLQSDQTSLRLEEVWYVPELRTIKLISITCLNDSGIEVVFKPGRTVEAHKDCRLVFTGSTNSGLVVLDLKHLPPAGAKVYITTSATATSAPELTATPVMETKFDLWHRRLAHTSIKTMQDLTKAVYGLDLGEKSQKPPGEKACLPCLAGKMHESFNKTTDTRASRPLERIHADISGIKAKTKRGYRYFLLLVDDYTRYYWLYLLRTKETMEVVSIFKQFRAMVETENHAMDRKIVYFRADNGKGEFGVGLQQELITMGIQFEPSPPYKHSMNGVVERAMRTVNERTRSIVYEAKLPYDLWDFAVEHAVFVRNRVLTKGIIEKITPSEKYSGHKPDLSKLRVFGCAAYPALSLATFPKKYDPRFKDKEYIYVGLRGSKIYKLLSLKDFKEYSSADVSFDEYIFPASKLLSERQVPSELDQEASQRATSRIDRLNAAPSLCLPENVQRSIEPIRELATPYRADQMEPIVEQVAPVVAKEFESVVEQDAPIVTNSKEVEPIVELDAPMVANLEPEPVVELYAPTVARSNTRIDQQLQLGDNSKVLHDRPRSGTETEASRKSTRARIPKKFFDDRVTRAILAEVRAEPEPELVGPIEPIEAISVEDAMREDAPSWLEAVDSELRSLKESKTYSIVAELPEGRQAVANRWVLKKKLNIDGSLARRKARLVVKGYSQTYGIDYTETFAPVVRFTTVLFLLIWATIHDLAIDHVDVDTAFLNPTLKEEVYMEIPDYFWRIESKPKGATKLYLRLRKSLYGLKQAPYEWYQEVDEYLATLGFTKSNADPNLYIKDNVYLLLYVDDNLIVGPRDQVDIVKTQLASRWKCKDLGPAILFVGLQINRDRNKTLQIHQSSYVSRLLTRFGLDQANSRRLPFDSGVRLEPDTPFEDASLIRLYQQLVGCLLYLSNRSRPDISWCVTQLARYMSQPGESHLRAAKEVLRYLKGTSTYGLIYDCSQPSSALAGYSDASWGTAYDGKSYTGWDVHYCGAVFSWCSNVQRSTAQSSMESEIIAANELSKELAWLERLWEEVTRTKQTPTLYCDNVSGIDVIHHPKHHSKSKHIDIRYFFIRNDMVARGRLKVVHIPGDDQIADILTKQLPWEKFSKLRNLLGVRKTD